MALIAPTSEVPSKSTITADSRIRRMSLHISWNAQSVLSERRDRWLNSENSENSEAACAWCTHSEFRVTTSLSSVRSLRFGRWHDRNEQIRSSPSHPMLVARSLFVPGFRNFALEISGSDKFHLRYRRRRETAEKKRMKRTFRFSAFGFQRDWRVRRSKVTPPWVL